jgi:hypothetical protein
MHLPIRCVVSHKQIDGRGRGRGELIYYGGDKLVFFSFFPSSPSKEALVLRFKEWCYYIKSTQIPRDSSSQYEHAIGSSWSCESTSCSALYRHSVAQVSFWSLGFRV